jgi:hypothetical protein
VKSDPEALCAVADTRWMVSVCNTYADFGEPIEAANALLVSVFVTMEKVAQTYIRWRLGYPATLDTPVGPHRKARLWDGMTSMNLDVGDASNDMFGRMCARLASTPELLAIFEAIMARMAAGDTVLAALDREHGHVFARDYSWILESRYDDVRASGRVPANKYAMYPKG